MVTCIQDPLFSERTSDFGFRTLDRRGVQRRWLTLVDDLNGMVSWSQWYVTPISCEATQAKRWLSVPTIILCVTWPTENRSLLPQSPIAPIGCRKHFSG